MTQLSCKTAVQMSMADWRHPSHSSRCCNNYDDNDENCDIDDDDDCEHEYDYDIDCDHDN